MSSGSGTAVSGMVAVSAATSKAVASSVRIATSGQREKSDLAP
jgi:hypothetical protein